MATKCCIELDSIMLSGKLPLFDSFWKKALLIGSSGYSWQYKMVLVEVSCWVLCRQIASMVADVWQGYDDALFCIIELI